MFAALAICVASFAFACKASTPMDIFSRHAPYQGVFAPNMQTRVHSGLQLPLALPCYPARFPQLLPFYSRAMYHNPLLAASAFGYPDPFAAFMQAYGPQYLPQMIPAFPLTQSSVSPSFALPARYYAEAAAVAERYSPPEATESPASPASASTAPEESIIPAIVPSTAPLEAKVLESAIPAIVPSPAPLEARVLSTRRPRDTRTKKRSSNDDPDCALTRGHKRTKTDKKHTRARESCDAPSGTEAFISASESSEQEDAVSKAREQEAAQRAAFLKVIQKRLGEAVQAAKEADRKRKESEDAERKAKKEKERAVQRALQEKYEADRRALQEKDEADRRALQERDEADRRALQEKDEADRRALQEKDANSKISVVGEQETEARIKAQMRSKIVKKARLLARAAKEHKMGEDLLARVAREKEIAVERARFGLEQSQATSRTPTFCGDDQAAATLGITG